jgi:hypothetical protein
MGIEVAVVEGLATAAILFASFSFLLSRKEHGTIQIFFFIVSLFFITGMLGAAYILATKDTVYTGMSRLMLVMFGGSLFLSVFITFYFFWMGMKHYLEDIAIRIGIKNKKIDAMQEKGRLRG